MPDAAWKAWERTVARIFGGQRRGADTRGPEGGKIDVIHSVTGHLNPALCGAAGAGDLVSGQGARPAKATSALPRPLRKDQDLRALSKLSKDPRIRRLTIHARAPA